MRPLKLTEEEIFVIYNLHYVDKFTAKELSEAFGVSERSIYYYLKRYRLQSQESFTSMFCYGHVNKKFVNELLENAKRKIYGQNYTKKKEEKRKITKEKRMKKMFIRRSATRRKNLEKKLKKNQKSS